MQFDQIKWPKQQRDPDVVKNEKSARYECEHCKSLWSDHDRDRAVRAGHWKHLPGGWLGRKNEKFEPGEQLYKFMWHNKPKSIGFHIPAWISPFIGLSESASAFLSSLRDKIKLRDFMNAYKAEPWRSYSVARTEDTIRALTDDRPRGLVPSGDVVAGLVSGVDTQDYDFRYQIVAVGWGLTEEVWQIREGVANTFEALEQILFHDRYTDVDGKEYLVQFVVQDAMGHRAKEVYDFARTHKGHLVAFKGEQRMNQPWQFTVIDRYPGSNKPIPGGIKLLRANVNFYKNALSRKLEIAAADPGAWHMHGEITDDWARQMTSEYVDDHGLWQQMVGRANHAWDVSVYGLIAADVIGMKFWKPRPSVDKTSPGKKAAIANQAKKTGFLPQVKKWL